MKTFLLIFSLGAICLCSCKKQVIENRLTGEWKFAYEVEEDGSRNYEDPYAMLEFNYSDGILLQENGTGYSKWYDKINSDPFQWSNTKESLIIELQNGQAFSFTISNVSKSSMDIETPQGFNYHLIKE